LQVNVLEEKLISHKQSHKHSKTAPTHDASEQEEAEQDEFCFRKDKEKLGSQSSKSNLRQLKYEIEIVS
jgi:hypothetical protein